MSRSRKGVSHGLLQEFHAVYAQHAIGQQQHHAVIPNLQLVQEIERTLGSRFL